MHVVFLFCPNLDEDCYTMSLVLPKMVFLDAGMKLICDLFKSPRSTLLQSTLEFPQEPFLAILALRGESLLIPLASMPR